MTEHAPDSPATGRLRELLLTAGAAAGAVCLLAAVASAFLGIKPLIFRSGSMSPAIETGALALAQTVPAQDLRVGDVVSVTTPATRVTHRLVEIQPAGERVALVLQGDANQVPDAAPYVVDEADRVFFHVEGLGYVVSWLSSPPAVFLSGVLVGSFLVLAFGRLTGRVASEGKGGRGEALPVPATTRRQKTRRVVEGRKRWSAFSPRAAGAGLVAALVLATGGSAGASLALDTEAAFTDVASASASMKALTVAPPQNTRCLSGGSLLGLLSSSDVEIAWRHVDAAYRYRVDVHPSSNLGGTPLSSTVVVPDVAVGTDEHIRFSPGLLTDQGNDYTVVVRSQLASASAWRSVATSALMTQERSLLSTVMKCGN